VSAPKEIRVGDEWVYDTNTGGISRSVTHVDAERVHYRGYGDPYEKDCALRTFKRWLKGARLAFATDWTGRGTNG
jgi:hypothetical protein